MTCDLEAGSRGSRAIAQTHDPRAARCAYSMGGALLQWGRAGCIILHHGCIMAASWLHHGCIMAASWAGWLAAIAIIRWVVARVQEVAGIAFGGLWAMGHRAWQPLPSPNRALCWVVPSSLMGDGRWATVLGVSNGLSTSGRHYAHHAPHTLSTRMEIRTWRSAIAVLRTPPPGAPSGALGEGNPGWVWRCGAAISRYKEKTCLFGRRFFTCSQNE